jgi:hypothetical protein
MTPSLYSDIINSRSNYPGTVKEHRIGQSAAKRLCGRTDEGSTTIPQGSRAFLSEMVGFGSITMYLYNMYKIYSLSCSKTKEIRYVGVTSRSLKGRLSGHLYNSKNIVQTSLPVSKWIASLNGEVSIDALEECDSGWQEREKRWIRKLNKSNSLLNLEEGGVGVNRGRRPATIESKKKSVDMFSPDGEYIRTFSSITEAVERLSLKSPSSITNILKRDQNTNVRQRMRVFAGGYRWAYSGSKPIPIKRIKVFRNGSVYFFWTMKEAADTLRFCRDKATRYLKGLRGPIRGLRIEYDIV